MKAVKKLKDDKAAGEEMESPQRCGDMEGNGYRNGCKGCVRELGERRGGWKNRMKVLQYRF